MKTAGSEILQTIGTEMWAVAGTVPVAPRLYAEHSPRPAPAPRLSLAAQRHMKRLTLDVPVDLHCRMKQDCAGKGVKMVDVLREMLETRFPG